MKHVRSILNIKPLILFLFGLFTIQSFSETVKFNIKFTEIKEQLEKYCYNCLDQSLQKFEKATVALEKEIRLNSKVTNTRDKEILLSESYEQLIYDFYNINKSKQITYRAKQYKLFNGLIKISNTKKELNIFGKKFADAYIREWEASNKTFDDPEYLVYIQKVNKLDQDMRSYVKKIKIQIPSKVRLLNERANQLALTDADIKLIGEVVNEIFEIDPPLTSEKKIYYEHVINSLITVVKLNQLSSNQLSKVSRSAIILQNHRFANKWKTLDDIIWWCEVRNIEEKIEQLRFINNQMLSKRRLDALKMLIEFGQVAIVEKWSDKLTFENSETIFNLAIREAKLRKATLEKKSNLAKLFQKQISQSVTEIIENRLFEDSQYQQHIQWLIIQTGTHRQNKNFKQILKNLAQNNLFYNKELTKNTSIEEKKKLSKELEDQLNITSDAQYLLNQIDYDDRD